MAEKSLEAHLYECLKRGNTERGDTKRALYIIELLGDDVNKLYRGKSPLLWAKEFENEEVAKVLEEKGAKEEVISEEEAERLGLELIEASLWGHKDEVEQLIEAGADVNAKNYQGETALMQASHQGHLEIVEQLIEASADINAKNERGNTALMKAASRKGYIDIVEKLIEKGADINAKNYEGWTALMQASRYGPKNIVEKLIEAGADVNASDGREKTAMRMASNEMRKVIIEAVKKKNEKGKENEPSFMDRVKGLFGKGE